MIGWCCTFCLKYWYHRVLIFFKVNSEAIRTPIPAGGAKQPTGLLVPWATYQISSQNQKFCLGRVSFTKVYILFKPHNRKKSLWVYICMARWAPPLYSRVCSQMKNICVVHTCLKFQSLPSLPFDRNQSLFKVLKNVFQPQGRFWHLPRKLLEWYACLCKHWMFA